MSVTRFHRCSVLLILASLPLLLASMCSDEEVATAIDEEEEFAASVTLQASGMANNECIHLFGPGETFPCCQVCQVAGGLSSRTTVVTLKRDRNITFRAGRNGQILDTQSCRVEGSEGSAFGVNWIGAGLVCGSGFGG